MSKLHEIAVLGQSIWYDNIRRAMLDHGELTRLLHEGIYGITSNPTIFEKAIVGSADYDAELSRYALSGAPIDVIYEALATDDIRRAADQLAVAYTSTGGIDGYVSLEVSPELAHDEEGTFNEARRLFAVLGRLNVMIKVPATDAGIRAFRRLTAAGVNVNVTLIFSVNQYEQIAEAYLAGLEDRLARGQSAARIASVASFFVSRVDTAVDPLIEAAGITSLLGRIAVANAKVAYQRFSAIFSGSRWERLAEAGAFVQRPLWASTGTKNPKYSDTLYVDSLIGPATVNTVPPATLQAVLDHGFPRQTIGSHLDAEVAALERLASIGIDLDAVCQQLLDDGVASFAKSFESLRKGIAEKMERLKEGRAEFSGRLGHFRGMVDTALAKLDADSVLQRIWSHDHTVWKPAPDEITNRLGWLHLPDTMAGQTADITGFVDAVRREGFTQVLLLGMGGSSLAPEVFGKIFGVADGYLDLRVLDSTSPEAVAAAEKALDLPRTLFVVSTKSGGTVETFSFFRYFYNRVLRAVGAANAGNHFVAITDPGSGLAEAAALYRFRKTFLNDPNIGGRYSALSMFGLVPAALIGVDIAAVLDRARTMASNCGASTVAVGAHNSAAFLGAAMGEFAAIGRDKITIITSPRLTPFGPWAEQLIAESTGKEGKGILPVVHEPFEFAGNFRNDRLFVYLRLDDDDALDATVFALEEVEEPVLRFNLRDTYDLGGEFFRWEMATAIASRRLGINPFDQPNVESAKVLARTMVAAYQQDGKLPEDAPTAEWQEIAVYSQEEVHDPWEGLQALLGHVRMWQDAGVPLGYVAIQAYAPPSEALDAALERFRLAIRDTLRVAVTVGYGPRFLHSTGQLHKGDAGNGVFVQITTEPAADLPIPDEAGSDASSFSFGVLIQAQALGDRQALIEAGRIVTRFHLREDPVASLALLQRAVTG